MEKIKSVSSDHSQDYSPLMNLHIRKRYHWFLYLLAFAIIVIAYWGVTTNSDWGGYEYWFEHDATGTDIAFTFLSTWFNDHGLTFRMLYRFHIFLIAFFYVLLFRKLSVNPVLFTVLMLLFNYVAMGNQIRYYVGFPMALLALSYFVEEKYVLAAVFGVLAFFFHSSIALFLAIFVFYYFVLSKLKQSSRLIVVVVANVILFYLIRNMGVSDNFESYLIEKERISSTLGGIYNLFPSMIYLYFAYLIDKEIKRKQLSYSLTNEYKFLYTSIMIGAVLFLTSIPTQIIATRMMGVALMPIWLTYFIRVKELKIKRINKQVDLFMFIFFLFYTLHLLGVFTGSNHYIYHIKEMFNSYIL